MRKKLIMRSDLLYDGTDIEKLEDAKRLVLKMKEDLLIPDEVPYEIESSIQLIQDRVLDFTDRSSVLTAKKYGFDSDGFKKGKPLERALFYHNPYMTCSWCNQLTFIDVQKLHRKIILPKEIGDRISSEGIPSCLGCGKCDYFILGSHDFRSIIANRDKVLLERRRVEGAASLIILKAYRIYLKRKYASALAKARKARKLLEYKAATTIASLGRGRLGRRMYITEKNLEIIKNCHYVLREWAVKPIAGRKQLFWYKRQIEIDMLYHNYVDLCERLGFDPPRQTVEENLKLIAERIIARKSELLCSIQRVWRGFMCRRIVKYYRTEVIRLKQFVISRLMKIQRAFRGFISRLKIPKLVAIMRREKLVEQYTTWAGNNLREARIKDLKERTMIRYKLEMREEQTARFTQRADLASDHDDRKLRAFAASCYSDNLLTIETDKLLDVTMSDIKNDKLTKIKDTERRLFIDKRIAEYGPTTYGQRGEIPTDTHPVIRNGFLVSKKPESSRSKGMRGMFEEERLVLMANLIDCTVKDQTMFNRGALGRFKEYNDARLKMRAQATIPTAAHAPVEVVPIVTARRLTSRNSIRARSSTPITTTTTTATAATTTAATTAAARANAVDRTTATPVPVKKAKASRAGPAEFRPIDFKFPKNINDKPIEWLFEDDVLVKYK